MTAIVVVLGLLSGTALGSDSCRQQIPPFLADATTKAFPDFRLPLATDNSADDVAWNRRDGGNGCFGVASGDFNGDSVKDFILGLTARKGERGLIVVGIARGKGWTLEKLRDWPESRLRLFVGVAPAGTYSQTEALEGNPPPLICPHSVAVFGGIEAWSVTYCLQEGSWRSIQTSD